MSHFKTIPCEKKPRNHFTQKLTSENMVENGALFYFIVFVFLHLNFAQKLIYLLKMLYIHQNSICLTLAVETLQAFPSLDPIEISVDSKVNLLWPFLWRLQSLFLPVPPGPH